MFAKLHAALRRIHSELAQVLDADCIEAVCREVGHSFRQRVLDPVTTIHLFEVSRAELRSLNHRRILPRSEHDSKRSQMNGWLVVRKRSRPGYDLSAEKHALNLIDVGAEECNTT